jgi:hypothetical protein
VGFTLKFVIPTGANLDFLLRGTHQQPHEVRQRHEGRQEIQGSVAEGPAVH